MASYKRHEWLLEGEILIYILASAQNDKWQVRFKNPLGNNPRYIRKSTKHSSEVLATTFALDLFNDYRSRALLNLKVGNCTINYLIDKYGDEFDETTLGMVKSYNNAYWQRYIGDDDISVYTTSDIHDYFQWRIADKKERRDLEAHGKKKDWYWHSSESTISASTLKLERTAMRKLFRIGHKFGYIAQIPIFPQRFERMEGVHRLQSNQRRGRFDAEKDYNKILVPYFNKIRRGLKSSKWTPQLANPELPFCPEENQWESRLKRKNREDKKRETDPIYCHLYDRYHHAHFWFASLLIANSGIRPAACHKLRHRDIRLVKDSDGKAYTLIHISESISKTKRSRTVVCRDFHKTYERYLLFRKEIEYRFNRRLTDDDFVFPSTSRKEFYINHRKNYDSVFRTHFKRLKLHTREVTTAKGQKVKVFFSAYSYRSFYITERLKNGLDLYTLSKNVGSSPKTILSSYDYNEPWQFRDKITQHYKSEPSSDCPPELEEHLSSSNLFS